MHPKDRFELIRVILLMAAFLTIMAVLESIPLNLPRS